MNQRTTRRNLIRAAGLIAPGGAWSAWPTTVTTSSRPESAMKMRYDAAASQHEVPAQPGNSNGDEANLPRWIGCFTKGLPTSQSGEVEAGTYESLLRALESGKHADFEAILRGSGRRLVNPQAAYAYTMEGGDAHRFATAPAPAFSSPEMAAEMAEMYWLSLARDVPFRDYSTSPTLEAAASELGGSPRKLFRSLVPGDDHGPYISQLLARPIQTVSTIFEQKYRTPVESVDFLATFPEWFHSQSGVPPWREYAWDPTPRYIRNGRDLAEWVHYDYLYQGFLNAALILMNYRPEAALNENRSVLNELNPYKYSKVQDGFVTFGLAQVADWLGRVTTASLKATWTQKWLVHRRLRPEAYGGRIHQKRSGVIDYPLPESILQSAALEETFRRNATYLLPQAYPEGSPLHPSYPGGHATVAGACAAILKVFFDENALMPDCVHASADGLSLEPCPAEFVPTIGAEVNKLASNICMGRSWAGIHYRSDSVAGLRIGEDVAISILQDLVRTPTEDFEGFAFTRFDGTRVHIHRNGEVT